MSAHLYDFNLTESLQIQLFTYLDEIHRFNITG